MKIKISLSLLVAVVVIAGWLWWSQKPWNIPATGELDYYLKNGRFITSEGIIPTGCFAQLKTELNGDDSVAAVFLNRTTLRGCIDANYPYPGGRQEEVYYEVEKQLSDHDYRLSICERVDGSMGQSCSKVVLRFANRTYFSPDGPLQVLSLEKLGEW